jgi:anti-anti-sigma factor
VTGYGHPTGVQQGGGRPGTLTVRRSDDRGEQVTIVRFEGEHDLATAAAVERALTEPPADEALVVDLSDCSFIDSSIISALVTARAARDRFAVAVSTQTSEALARILEITQLRHVLNCCETVEDAKVAAIGGERRTPRLARRPQP